MENLCSIEDEPKTPEDYEKMMLEASQWFSIHPDDDKWLRDLAYKFFGQYVESGDWSDVLKSPSHQSANAVADVEIQSQSHSQHQVKAKLKRKSRHKSKSKDVTKEELMSDDKVDVCKDNHGFKTAGVKESNVRNADGYAEPKISVEQLSTGFNNNEYPLSTANINRLGEITVNAKRRKTKRNQVISDDSPEFSSVKSSQNSGTVKSELNPKDGMELEEEELPDV